MAFATEKLSDKQITWQVALRLVRARISTLANAGQDARAIKHVRYTERRTGCQSYSSMVRYTELSPTGSEISGAEWQSEIVAAD